MDAYQIFTALEHFTTPQLKKLHSGKVRESFVWEEGKRLIVVTDRLSAFNKILEDPIPGKGAVLNNLSNFWFQKTAHIVPNHFIEQPDDNMSIVKEAVPVKVEMIVRGYLSGHAWREYEKGKRELSGQKLPDGMQKNDPFPEPVVTPTTKDKDDTDISPEEIISRGLASEELFEKMKSAALALYRFGSEFLKEKGIILADTKYEFGLIDGELHLIDEIHTPDSSRFWDREDYEKNPRQAEEMSKEFVRQWMLKNKKNGNLPANLPENIVEEVAGKYREIYKRITGNEIRESVCPPATRIHHLLVKRQRMEPGFIRIFSPTDHLALARSLGEGLKDLKIGFDVINLDETSGDFIKKKIEETNNAVEPVFVLLIGEPDKIRIFELADEFLVPSHIVPVPDVYGPEGENMIRFVMYQALVGLQLPHIKKTLKLLWKLEE